MGCKWADMGHQRVEGCSFVKSVTSQEVLALLKTESRLRRELIRAGLGDCLQAQFTTAAVACSRWAADNGKKTFSGLFFFFGWGDRAM